MNPLRLFYFVSPKTRQAKLLTADKPDATRLLLRYVLPLSLIPCVMMYVRVSSHYPKLFMDTLPGDRLVLISAELWLLQLGVILGVAWMTKSLAEMVNVKPTFRDALLIITIATIPLWLTSLFYMVPSLNVNVVVHGLAVLISIALIYRGVKYIFGLRERGAAAMLTMAIACSAGLGFAVMLVGSLISWEGIEQLQLTLQS